MNSLQTSNTFPANDSGETRDNLFVVDIGGTWIKAVSVPAEALASARESRSAKSKLCALVENPQRSPSPVGSSGRSLCETLLELGDRCGGRRKYRAVGISTAGSVDPSGLFIERCADHLAFLRSPGWREDLEEALGCPVTMINDANAFQLGAGELGYLDYSGTICSLVVGTGLGCSLMKDGRLWMPQNQQPLFGSIRTPVGSYDALVSASRLAAHSPDRNLVDCLRQPKYREIRESYWKNFTDVILTACFLYEAGKILIGGGICDASQRAGVDIREEILMRLKNLPPELDQWPEIDVVSEGNMVNLIGAAVVAVEPRKAES